MSTLTPTAYIVTPISTPPEDSGMYFVKKDSWGYPGRLLYSTELGWMIDERTQVPEKELPEAWLRPVDLSRLLEEAFEMSSLAFTKNMQYANGVATFNEQGFQADKAAYINSVLNPPK